MLNLEKSSFREIVVYILVDHILYRFIRKTYSFDHTMTHKKPQQDLIERQQVMNSFSGPIRSKYSWCAAGADYKPFGCNFLISLATASKWVITCYSFILGRSHIYTFISHIAASMHWCPRIHINFTRWWLIRSNNCEQL